jgi:3-oxoacyl-[acyl-carrier-protein] synthase-3
LGCSGYLYGLIQSYSLINSNLRKILLLAGETNSKIVSSNDKTTKMVFGDGGTATLIENCGIEEDEIIFDYGSDGDGYKNIIMNSGGIRNLFSIESLSMNSFGSGILKSDIHISMDGLEVMNFAISRVPESIKKCTSTIDESSIDRYYLHQANKFMLGYISRKAKLDANQVPFNAEEIGNTGPASIPIAIAKDIQNNYLPNKSILSGFGVGLSWATCLINLKTINKAEIYDYEN